MEKRPKGGCHFFVTEGGRCAGQAVKRCGVHPWADLDVFPVFSVISNYFDIIYVYIYLYIYKSIML